MNRTYLIAGFLLTTSFLNISHAQDFSKKTNDLECVKSISEKKEQDRYAWLKDPSWTNEKPEIKNKKIKKIIKKQQQNVEQFLSQHAKEQQKIKEEWLSLASLETSPPDTPRKVGNLFFFDEPDEITGLKKIYRSKEENLKNKELVLDLATLVKLEDEEEVEVDYLISPDGNYILYSVEYDDSEFKKTRVYDIKNQKQLREKFVSTDLETNFAWASNSSKGFYYLECDKNNLPSILKWHEYNQKSANDPTLFSEKTGDYFLNLISPANSNQIILGVLGHENSELYIINEHQKLIKILDCCDNYQIAGAAEYQGEFYLALHDSQSQGTVRKVSMKESRVIYETIIPPTEGLIFSDLDVFDLGMIAVLTKPEGDELVLWDAKEQKFVSLTPELKGKKITIEEDQDPSSSKIKFEYRSFFHPNLKAQVSFEGKLENMTSLPELPNYTPNQYVMSHVYAPTEDGEKIPITLLYHKGKQKDGDNPLLLQAYGAYGDSDYDDIDYDPTTIALLNSGVTIAYAYVRGGGIYGPKWHKAGKGLNKKNTFEDYISCAEYLIKTDKVKKGNLVAQGGSAGGLIMGYIANTQPNLFKAVIAQVPFLHLYQDCMDSKLLLTSKEKSEWGDIKQKEVSHYIQSYCPYENLKKQDYPAMLIQYGLYDNKVPYWNALKYGEKLKDLNTSSHPIILQPLESGHETSLEGEITLLLFFKSLFGDKIDFFLK
jgi:oligopeptidase B